MKSLNHQIGGSHYKNMAIQPLEFIQKNRLGFCEGNIIKYVCRYRHKNGPEDLLKARHYLDVLLDAYPGQPEVFNEPENSGIAEIDPAEKINLFCRIHQGDGRTFESRRHPGDGKDGTDL